MFGSAWFVGKSGQISDEDIRQMPFVKMCVLEAVRLHSAGVIARKVLQSFKIKVTIRHSSLSAVYAGVSRMVECPLQEQ